MIRPVHQEVVGWKNRKKFSEEPGNYIMHSKCSKRHDERNAGYVLFDYKFKHEMGGPGSQLKVSFTDRYPQFSWESVYPRNRKDK